LSHKTIDRRKTIAVISAAVLAVLAFIVSIFIGSSDMSFTDSLAGLFRYGTNLQVRVIWNIRLPRIIAGFVVGFGLAIAGVAMQSTLQNPMASPSTLGVSNAAVFGANLGIVVFGSGVITMNGPILSSVDNPYLVAIFAFAFALASAFLTLLLSKVRHFSSETVVLAGIAFGTLFSAGTTLIQYFAVDTDLASAVYWTFGDLSRASYTEDLVLAGAMVVVFMCLVFMSRSLDAMVCGDDVAKSLGVRVGLVRFLSLLLASAFTALSISIMGIIGFLGIMAPHIMKRIVGSEHRFLLPASGFVGAFILLVSDMFARSLLSGASLPVGALTSLLGAPVFLYIVFAKKTERPLCSR